MAVPGRSLLKHVPFSCRRFTPDNVRTDMGQECHSDLYISPFRAVCHPESDARTACPLVAYKSLNPVPSYAAHLNKLSPLRRIPLGLCPTTHAFPMQTASA